MGGGGGGGGGERKREGKKRGGGGYYKRYSTNKTNEDAVTDSRMSKIMKADLKLTITIVGDI